MSNNIPSIAKEAYYAGQLLQVDDFNREQNFHIQHRNFATRQLLSPGVLSGLSISTNGSTITVAPGASINAKGEYILLMTDEPYVVSESDGNYQLYISYRMVPAPNVKNQLISNPLLSLVPSGNAMNNDVLLANVTVKDKMVSDLLPSSSAVKILSSMIPDQAIKYLDASAITTGIFNKDRIPGLQELNGKLTHAQLPILPDNGAAIFQNSFSPGVLFGLIPSSTGKTIQLTIGIAVDDSGNQISLDKDATYKNNTITSQNGSFSFDMSDVDFQDKTWLLLLSKNDTNPDSPILEFIENIDSRKGKVILATITFVDDMPIVSHEDRVNVQLLASRLPRLTPDLIPNLQDLSGKVRSKQLPDLQEMNGTLNEGQIPELKNLRGQITMQQLSTDIVAAQNHLIFFVDTPVTGEGNTIEFNWNTHGGVDRLSLSYFSETGNNIIVTTDNNTIQLPQGSYSCAVTKTTVFTLSALIQGNMVDQKQLTITVFTLRELVRLQFTNKKTATDCVALIVSQLPSTTALQSAIALADVGYTFEDTGTAIKIGYNITNPTEFGRIMAAAFPPDTTPTLLSVAQQLFSDNRSARDCVEELIKRFEWATAQDSATAMAKAGYTFEDTGLAIKTSYNITNPTEFGRIMAIAFPT